MMTLHTLLLSSCATAFALTAIGSAAQAQVGAFQGGGTVVFGGATIDDTGGTIAAPRTNVQIDSPSAVIDWTPSDSSSGSTPIDFLPSNGLVVFSSSNEPNFVVLNRIVPRIDRPVGLNGSVLGLVGGKAPGGNIWFYSPTGIVAGSGSSFSADGLVLTANDIAFDPEFGPSFPSDGTIQFTASAGSQARVIFNGRITTSGDNGYALLVAPGVTQAGTIEGDGSVALIAAEEATITVQNSLFDIGIGVGTSVADAITHSGVTGLAISGDTVSGSQKVVIMAAPQNTALTMLLGGTFGATAASSAGADRAVILSGGYEYSDLFGAGLAAEPYTTTPVDMQIGASTVNADLIAQTTGSIMISPSGGSALTVQGNASLLAENTVSVTADFPNVDSFVTAGSLNIVAITGDITLTGGAAASGDLILASGRDIDGRAGTPRLEGQTVRLTAARDLAGDNLSIISHGELGIDVGRDLLAQAIDAAGNLVGVDVGDPPQPGPLTVPGELTIGTLTLRGGLSGNLTAGGDLSIDNAMAAGLDLVSGGTLGIGSLHAFPGGPSGFLTVTAPTLFLDSIEVSGNITGTATQTDATLANLNAGGTASITAAGTVHIAGPVSAATIMVNSGDIDVSATLGTPGVTSLIELTNNSGRTSYYGGAVNPGGYSLSAAEVAKLHADDIALVASQDVVVGAMAVTGRATDPAGQLGSGDFTIKTTGQVQIGGIVNFTGLASGNGFVIGAGSRIALDNQAGSVSLTGPDGSLAGKIDFSAGTIMAASSTVQAALASLSDAAAIDAMLGRNDGAVHDQGVLRAGTMRFSAANGLYIQNTGTGTAFAQRRGFTVGQGGIAVTASGGTPLVVINGTAGGGSITGLNVIPLTLINGQPAPISSGTQPGSTINGCDFVNPNCSPTATEQVTPTRERVEVPVRSPSDSPSDPTVEKQVVTTTSVRIEDLPGMAYEPLIDEPVTGSGNDDLWTADCDPAKQGACPQPPERPTESR